MRSRESGKEDTGRIGSYLPGLRQAKVESKRLNPGLPCMWQGSKYLNSHLVPARCLLNKHRNQELNPKHSNTGSMCPKKGFNCCTKCLLLVIALLMKCQQQKTSGAKSVRSMPLNQKHEFSTFTL